MRCRQFAIALVLLTANQALAADPLPPELALIPKDAAAFVSIRYDLLGATPFGKALLFGGSPRPEVFEALEKKWLGFPLDEVERVTAVFPQLTGRFTMEDIPLFVVTRTKKIDRDSLLSTIHARPISDRYKEMAIGELNQPGRTRPVRFRGAPYATDEERLLLYFVGDRTVVLATPGSYLGLFRLLGQHLDPSDDAPLTAALNAAAGKDVVVAGMTGPAIKNLLAAWPEKEREFAALADARAVSVRVGITPDFVLNVAADFRDGPSARRARSALAGLSTWTTETLQKTVRGMGKDEERFADLFGAALKEAGEPQLDGKTVTLTVAIKGEASVQAAEAAARSAAVRIRASTDRLNKVNYLKQIGLAIHNYHDTNGEFPFKQRAPAGLHPGLSWRVAILPFIEEEKLFKEFKLDEPWDSETNKKLIRKMPKLFAPPPGVNAKPGHTFLRMFDGPGTISRVSKLIDVWNGTSNTLTVVEAADTEVWTKPDELDYDTKKPLPKLGGHFEDGFHILFADGSVRFIKSPVTEKELRAWITAKEDTPGKK